MQARLPRIGFFGLGLMGGSLALALASRAHSLQACDPHAPTRALALRQRVVTQVHEQVETMLPAIDLLILAAPVRANLDLLARLPSLCPHPLMVLDLSSTKQEIVQAMAALPSRFDPLGGHPMCGKETSGLAQAEATLFRGAAWAFTPLERTSGRLRALAADIARAVGARPLWLDAATHDRWTAAVSHLPYLLAAALLQATPPENLPLRGPGFRSSTRLAGSHPQMMLDILLTNRTAVLQALQSFRAALNQLETALQSADEPSLARQLQAIQRRYYQEKQG